MLVREYVQVSFMRNIIGLLIGAIEFELYNKFYAKGNMKKILDGLIIVTIIDLVILFCLRFIEHYY